MKKLSSIILTIMGIGISAMAHNWQYEPVINQTDEYGVPLTGGIFNLSPNGKWAVCYDDFYVIGAYWNFDNPDDFVVLPNRGRAYDVSDDGVIVGNYRTDYSDVTTSRPGVFRNGEWEPLELSDKCLNDGITATAKCISRDGIYIAGQQIVSRDDEEYTGGAKIPCLWKLNESTDKYELIACYDDPQIQNQGFWVTCMNDDASIIAGLLTCGAGSSTIPAMFKDGELKIWNELETRNLPFYYKGQIMGYDDEFFIDGHHDNTGSDFMGMFYSFGTDGKLYGYRTSVTDIVKDAHGDGLDAGTLHVNGCIYDPETDTFEDSDQEWVIYTTGLVDKDGNHIVFSNTGVMRNGTTTPVNEYFGIRPQYSDGIVIYSCDENGLVYGGGVGSFNSTTNTVDEYPIVIVLEEAYSSVDAIAEEAMEEVEQIYSLDGTRMECNGALKPGIYVMKSPRGSKKVLIK